MPPIAVHEVTTFYNMYNQAAGGRYKFNVCTNLPCQLRDGQKALEHLCDRSSARRGGRHQRRRGCSPCRRANAWAPVPTRPVMLVNDRQMLSFMNNARLDELVSSLRHAEGGASP